MKRDRFAGRLCAWLPCRSNGKCGSGAHDRRASETTVRFRAYHKRLSKNVWRGPGKAGLPVKPCMHRQPVGSLAGADAAPISFDFFNRLLGCSVAMGSRAEVVDMVEGRTTMSERTAQALEATIP